MSAGVAISVDFDLLVPGLQYQSDVLVLGNESEILQSLEYLLSGAIKVSKRGTAVQLRVCLDRSRHVEMERENDFACCWEFGFLRSVQAEGGAGDGNDHLMVSGDDNSATDVRPLGMLSICIVDTGPGGHQVCGSTRPISLGEILFPLSLSFSLLLTVRSVMLYNRRIINPELCLHDTMLCCTPPTGSQEELDDIFRDVSPDLSNDLRGGQAGGLAYPSKSPHSLPWSFDAKEFCR